MKGKKQMVDLFNPGLKITEPYEINHAERILRMPNNGGWQLPEDSEHTFDFNDGIGNRENKPGVSGAKEEANNTKG